MTNRERAMNLLHYKPGVISIPAEHDYLMKDREAFETLYRPGCSITPKRSRKYLCKDRLEPKIRACMGFRLCSQNETEVLTCQKKLYIFRRLLKA